MVVNADGTATLAGVSGRWTIDESGALAFTWDNGHSDTYATRQGDGYVGSNKKDGSKRVMTRVAG
jgi:hypothetical protein